MSPCTPVASCLRRQVKTGLGWEPKGPHDTLRLLSRSVQRSPSESEVRAPPLSLSPRFFAPPPPPLPHFPVTTSLPPAIPDSNSILLGFKDGSPFAPVTWLPTPLWEACFQEDVPYILLISLHDDGDVVTLRTPQVWSVWPIPNGRSQECSSPPPSTSADLLAAARTCTRGWPAPSEEAACVQKPWCPFPCTSPLGPGSRELVFCGGSSP